MVNQMRPILNLLVFCLGLTLAGSVWAQTAAPPVVQAPRPQHPTRTVHRPPAAPAAPPAPASAVAPADDPAPAHVPDPARGTVSGLPLPRFAALRADEVNLRTGPGTRYPIDWVYHRRDLPVEIEREFEVWRLVSDPDGIKGWVHEATLSSRRGMLVVGQQRTLRRSAADTAPPVAYLKPGVVGHILSCEKASDWCEVQVTDYKGYLKRDEFWGTLPDEAVN
jgi:SH3-like domain-containing protein